MLSDSQIPAPRVPITGAEGGIITREWFRFFNYVYETLLRPPRNDSEMLEFRAGRAAAMAAGHGFIAGWAIAIAGDMMYYSVIAFSTLQMNSVIKSPEVTMMLVLMGMIFIPKLIRKLFNKH